MIQQTRSRLLEPTSLRPGHARRATDFIPVRMTAMGHDLARSPVRYPRAREETAVRHGCRLWPETGAQARHVIMHASAVRGHDGRILSMATPTTDNPSGIHYLCCKWRCVLGLSMQARDTLSKRATGGHAAWHGFRAEACQSVLECANEVIHKVLRVLASIARHTARLQWSISPSEQPAGGAQQAYSSGLCRLGWLERALNDAPKSTSSRRRANGPHRASPRWWDCLLSLTFYGP